MNRRFVVLLSRPPPTCRCEFHIDDLPGSGRFDHIARCVNAALLLSNGTRRDTELILVFGRHDEASEEVWVIRIHGDEVRHIRPDERSTAWILLTALHPKPCTPAMTTKRTREAPVTQTLPKVCVSLAEQHSESSSIYDGGAHKCCKGVTCTLWPSLRSVLADCAAEACGGLLHQLSLEATLQAESAISLLAGAVGPMTFVLGDDRGFTEEAQVALEATGAARPVALGSDMLLTSHAIVFLHCLMLNAHSRDRPAAVH